MSPTAITKTYQVQDLGPLQIGREAVFTATGSKVPSLSKGKPWGLPAGAYTARQIVEANAPLLETVLHHLGDSPSGEPAAREMLIDNLASNLAINTRESTITIPERDDSRVELAKQAAVIGKKLIEYVKSVTDVPYDPDYVVRSPCEGHLWTPAVAQLMFGPRSLRHLAQIFNEYLHQMVLLRDALLPFDNFEDVIIPITVHSSQKLGLRYTEEARAGFLTEISTKQVTQRSILKSAQSLLTPELSNDNFHGFQYKYGTILPSFIAGGESSRLLQYIPAVFEEKHDEVFFQNEFVDYYEAPKSDLSANDGTSSGEINLVQALLEPLRVKKDEFLQLSIQYDNGSVAKTDLGQVARGRRYAFYLDDKLPPASDGEENVEGLQVHSAWSVLLNSGEGLVIPAKGVHLIKANSRIELYALLGKLYPDNVVVFERGQSLNAALQSGRKGLPDAGRVIIELNI